jgi:hypothetical protein
VAAYNADPSVHGILVQLPLPKHINETRVLDAISLDKDVDGFHPENIGSLAMRGRKPKFVSCTPKVRRLPGMGMGILCRPLYVPSIHMNDAPSAQQPGAVQQFMMCTSAVSVHPTCVGIVVVPALTGLH